jgi:hypothetical protein
MLRKAMVVALVGLLWAAGRSPAQVPVSTATGVIEKVGKDSLTVLPRGASGKFEKSLVLKVAGTSNVFILTTRMQGRKTIAQQRQVKADDLKKDQPVAIIYIKAKDGAILLCAVAQPAK